MSNIHKLSLKQIFEEKDSHSNTSGPRSLRILDFDHTVAFTGEMVYIMSPEGTKVDKIDSESYSHHEFSRDEILAGYYYDFSEFDGVDSDSAKENVYVTQILKNFINAGNTDDCMILILTARNQEAEEGIRNYLETIGIDHSNIIIVGVGSSAPQKKVDEVSEILNQNQSIEEVSFFDDSLSNTDEMMRFLSSYQREDGENIIFDVAKVEEDGRLTRKPGYRTQRR